MRKISVIIPFYKYVPYLADALESLAAQSFRDFETIIVKDGAEDISSLSSITDRLPEVRILELSKGEPEGVAAARNYGIDHADGEYVYFLDSDDFIEEDALEKLYAECQRGKEKPDIVYGSKQKTWYKRDNYKAIKEKDAGRELVNINAILPSGIVMFGYAPDREVSDDVSGKASDKVSDKVSDKDYNHALRRACYELIWMRPGVTNVTVLNILFKREFLQSEDIRFKEELKYYCEMPFLAEAIVKAKGLVFVKDALYLERNHNDPLNFPSLTQQKGARYDYYMKSVEYTYEVTEKGSLVRMAADQKLIEYMLSYVFGKFTKAGTDNWNTDIYEKIRKMARDFAPEQLKYLKAYPKKALTLLRQGRKDRLIAMVKRHNKIEKFMTNIKRKYGIRIMIYNHFFVRRRVKENYVMFESFFGKYFSDSPRAIYEYMLKAFGKSKTDRKASEEKKRDYRYIWVTREKGNANTDIPGKPLIVRRNSLKYFYYMAVSKYFVFNTRQPYWYKKRKGQVFLETWHGTPLKKLIFDQEEVTTASPYMKTEFYTQSRCWDYLISPNKFCSEIFPRCFMYDKKLLETGYPRNDILKNAASEKMRHELRKKLGIPDGKKTILYAPTWRDDEYYGKGKYKFTLMLDLKKMKAELGDEYVVLLRTHYYIADSLDLEGVEDFALNFSKYDEISHLYLVSDILLTDYSSVFFDYASLKRPMIFYTYDMDKYRDLLRGFYIDMFTEVPGPLAFTTEEVIDKIKHIDKVEEEYKELYDRFYDRFCSWEDGKASERVVEQVFEDNKR